MTTQPIGTSTSDPDLDDLFCSCPLAAGDEVKIEIDDGAILLSCSRCGKQVSLEDVSVHAPARVATLTAEVSDTETWLEARI